MTIPKDGTVLNGVFYLNGQTWLLLNPDEPLKKQLAKSLRDQRQYIARLTKRADDLEKWLTNMNPMKKWIAEHGELTDQQKTIRSHIRGFCLGFTEEELVREEKIRKNEDPFRSVCIREIIFEEDC